MAAGAIHLMHRSRKLGCIGLLLASTTATVRIMIGSRLVRKADQVPVNGARLA
ncbi:hypothetical protein M404DRAFT_999175 [Pisolithus tinctorius Marx 270]|uniref:Uncharacterized protein n=1 Tax=Pisolithus tinctorius Marx 270 TaxID=870435 RepID=A0A0C3NHB3_PISTI|nr:hypothetical protein M404DRAFT_1007761 [Pisolithus tinctorius Marx 270]KIO06545.1 hypothetical protein M404DRAFT_999175 [Pisolithus tinctorius Marx 270]